MLKREFGAESNGKLLHLFIPSKTATQVPQFSMEDLPLGRTAALVTEFAVKDLPLGRTLRMRIYIKVNFTGERFQGLHSIILQSFNKNLMCFQQLHIITTISEEYRTKYRVQLCNTTSQLILQPFRCFTYVTAHSPTLLSLLLRHRLFTYVT